ncbi:MAG: O-antigen ligase family protein [Actinomycetota bacterium]|nr:O-antigen ligase family protein [Actinomycetota bacterium]
MSSLVTAPRRAAPGRPRATQRARALTAQASVDLKLGAGLAAAFAAVAFVTTGGTDIGGLDLAPNTWTEIALLVVGLSLALAVPVFASRGPAFGIAPVALFAAVAAFTAASIAWSVQPDNSWLEANRTLSYLAAFTGAVALARLFPRRWPALTGAIAVAATVLSAYALLVKVFPGSLDAQDTLGRLNAPFQYWNATGLIAALGVPPCLWAGSRRESRRLLRALSVPAVAILLVVVVLSYSRSAVLAVLIGAGCWFAAVPTRLRGALVLALGAAGGAVITAWALGREAFTHDQVSLAARTSAGHSFGVLLLVVLVILTIGGFAAAFGLDRAKLSATRRRRAGALLLTLLALVPVGGVAALAASHRGLTGEISHVWSTLTSTKAGVGDSPSRLVNVANSRPQYWHEGITVATHSLLKGVGALGYGTARARYSSDPHLVQHAHSYVIETFADFGLIGLVLNLGLLIAWASAAGRAVAAPGLRLGRGAGDESLTATGGSPSPNPPATEDAPPPPDHTAERAGLLTLLCVVIGFGVHSAIDWTWFVPGVAVPALVCAGWLAGRGPLDAPIGRAAKRRELRRSPILVLAATAVAALGVLGAWAIWQPLRAADADSAGIAAISHGDTAAAIADARTAASSDPLAVEPLFELSALYSAAGRPGEARIELVKAVRLQPENAASWQQLGLYDLDHHRPVSALASLHRAHRLDLTDYPTVAAIGQATAAAAAAKRP